MVHRVGGGGASEQPRDANAHPGRARRRPRARHPGDSRRHTQQQAPVLDSICEGGDALPHVHPAPRPPYEPPAREARRLRHPRAQPGQCPGRFVGNNGSKS